MACGHAAPILVDFVGIFFCVEIEVGLGDEVLGAEEGRKAGVFEDCSAHGEGVL